MPSVIRVAIPANKSDAALKDYFRELVEDSHLGDPGELRPALDLDLVDHRATVDLITLEAVEILGQSVSVHYSFAFSSYSGCKDLLDEGEDEGCIEGTTDGKDWVFPVHVPPERLAPNEEL